MPGPRCPWGAGELELAPAPGAAAEWSLRLRAGEVSIRLATLAPSGSDGELSGLILARGRGAGLEVWARVSAPDERQERRLTLVCELGAGRRRS